MNKIISSIGLALILCGCATTKTTSVTSSTNALGQTIQTTNVVVAVNQANLALDCAGIQAATGLAVSIALQQDPSARADVLNVQATLNGILKGADSNSVAQITSLLKSSGNAAVTRNLAPLVSQASSLEQSLVAKYGTTVGGQIALAVANAINAGITSGLN